MQNKLDTGDGNIRESKDRKLSGGVLTFYNPSDLFQSPVVYIFWHGHTPLYVGSSKAGIGRPLAGTHSALDARDRADRIEIIFFQHVSDARLAERVMIAEYKPEFNIHVSKVTKWSRSWTYPSRRKVIFETILERSKYGKITTLKCTLPAYSGVIGRPTKYKIDLDKADALLDSGMAIKDIAAELGVPKAALTYRMSLPRNRV